MSVMLETSFGEIVIDLFTEEAPLAAKNFLKLCKIKYYNNNLIFNVQENYMFQTGDPTGTGNGGESLYEGRIIPTRKHDRKGLVGLATEGENLTSSQFYVTTRGDDLENLDGKHVVFGEVAEGMDVVDKINETYVDAKGRPFLDIRIRHTYVLDDPFSDPEPGSDSVSFQIPPSSPVGDRPSQETVAARISAESMEDAQEEDEDEEAMEKRLAEKEAKSRAVVLEMIGDIADAEMKPPEEVLFICKLNPVTTAEDLTLIFSRFGECKCDIIKDFKTGDSLCFGFVEFQKREHCEEAYFKMNNVLIDDRRIKVDFSQSVSKLWNQYGRSKPGNAPKTGVDGKKAQEDLEASMRGGGRKPQFDNSNGVHGRGKKTHEAYSRRERSRSRDRKRHKRSRSHSKDRTTRSGHRQVRDTKRDRMDRSRGDRERNRDRDRTRERDRDTGSRGHYRSRDADRVRDRSRDREDHRRSSRYC